MSDSTGVGNPPPLVATRVGTCVERELAILRGVSCLESIDADDVDGLWWKGMVPEAPRLWEGRAGVLDAIMCGGGSGVPTWTGMRQESIQ